jgi:VID27 N-terminal region
LVSVTNTSRFVHLTKDPTHPTVTKRLVYRDASCSIKRTGQSYQYQLVVERCDDGADESQDLEDTEQIFLIDPCLCFRVSKSNDQSPPRLIWADSDDESGTKGWEFQVDSEADALALQLFEETLFSCMFERVNHKAHDYAEEEELNTFVQDMKVCSSNSASRTGFSSWCMEKGSS